MVATTVPAPRSPNFFHTLFAPMFLMPHSTAATRTSGVADGVPRSRGTLSCGRTRLTSGRAASELTTAPGARFTLMPFMIQNDW